MINFQKSNAPKSRNGATRSQFVRFNYGCYELNLIKEHFTDTTAKLRVFFLDIINYLGPRTNYEKWMKAYKYAIEKSRLPYEWLEGCQIIRSSSHT